MALTVEPARCVVPDGTGMPAAPEWASATTRRLLSPVGARDGAVIPPVFRLNFPLLPSIGLDESTPV
jgi:hypothetical protein